MTTYAALMTGKGTGAISTIQVFGDSARTVLREIFKPVRTTAVSFETGQVLLGTICDGAETIDQVTVGCEGPENFAVHCHGNPIIVEMIMELLGKHQAKLVTAEQLLAETLAAQGAFNTIAIEARLAQPRTRTVEGTRIVVYQSEAGLAETAQRWLDGIDSMSLEQIKADAARILDNSRTARLIVYGCTAVITGPPNSGKSTLLNHLAGRQKAIVADVKGTTRDWVEAECRIGSMSVKLIDTAGLERSCGRTGIDEAAREKTTVLLEHADIVLLVLDGSVPGDDLDDELLGRISGRPVVTVVNKCDLPTKLDFCRLPKFLSDPIQTSAKEGIGMERLTLEIQAKSDTAQFNWRQPVCFTRRQEDLLGQLTRAQSKRHAASFIADLLMGPI